MRKVLIILAVLLVAVAAWYGVWRSMLSADVARVSASMEYHNQQFKTANRFATLKADGVRPVGFPFHSSIEIIRPTMTMISGQETFAVSFPQVRLEPQDVGQARYKVIAPATFQALYATNGAAPENYTVSVDKVPGLLVRAQGDSGKCSPFPGNKQCADVGAADPLITYATELPSSITLHVELNGDSRDISFQMIPLNIPVFMTIPKDMDRALQLFVGVLREALVFKTK